MKKVLLFAIFIRILISIIFVSVNNYDIESYRMIGKLILEGKEIYPNIAILHHPYLPFYLYILAATKYLEQFGILQILTLKILFSFFDVGILYFVYLLSKKDSKTAFLYAVNPVTIMITNIHGQFDVIPIFFLMIAIYYFLNQKPTISMLFLSVGILIKTWPLMFVIPFLKRMKHKLRAALVFLFPVIAVAIYVFFFHVDLKDILKTLINYRGAFRIWGTSKIFYLLTGRGGAKTIAVSSNIFALLFVAFSFFIKPKNILRELLILQLFFYLLTPTFGMQYLSWIIPFMIILRPAHWILFMLTSTLYLLTNYIPWIYRVNPNETLITISSFIVWLTIGVIFVYQLRYIRKP